MNQSTTRNAVPAVGDLHTFSSLSGYRPIQNRPFDCRHAICSCGSCNGVRTEITLAVERVIHWADNSTEVEATDSTGRVWRELVAAPSGDACY